MVGRDFGHSRELCATYVEGSHPGQRQWHPQSCRGSNNLQVSSIKRYAHLFNLFKNRNGKVVYEHI
jgi:hypothetical protein